MASSYVGGLSGAFIPVSEDAGMCAPWSRALTLEKLEAMTAVCSVGLDMVVIPGDTSADTISGILPMKSPSASSITKPREYVLFLRRDAMWGMWSISATCWVQGR